LKLTLGPNLNEVDKSFVVSQKILLRQTHDKTNPFKCNTYKKQGRGPCAVAPIPACVRMHERNAPTPFLPCEYALWPCTTGCGHTRAATGRLHRSADGFGRASAHCV